MKTQILFLTILASLLSSCMSQPSAPIDYGTQSSYSTSGNSSDSSDDIVEQPIIKEKTTWGDKVLDTEEAQNNIHTQTSNTLPSNELDIPSPTPLTSQPATPLRTEFISHEVIEGETIDSIARQYNIEKDSLIKANKLKAPYHLEELQILKIPPQISDKDNVSETVSVGDIISPNSTNGTPASSNPTPKLSSMLPVTGRIISKFGEDHTGVKNNGINIAAPIGSDVHSASAGTVVYSGNDPKFGNLIIIKSENDEVFMAYSHMNDLILKKEEHISKDQIIGHIGQTGNVTSPQLHFAVRRGKTPIDPEKYLSNSQ